MRVSRFNLLLNLRDYLSWFSFNSVRKDSSSSHWLWSLGSMMGSMIGSMMGMHLQEHLSSSWLLSFFAQSIIKEATEPSGVSVTLLFMYASWYSWIYSGYILIWDETKIRSKACLRVLFLIRERLQDMRAFLKIPVGLSFFENRMSGTWIRNLITSFWYFSVLSYLSFLAWSEQREYIRVSVSASHASLSA